MIVNLPNILSLTRILLVPLLVAVLLTKFEGKEFVGLAVFLVASLTDFLDGYIARRRKLVTKLGKLLDPAADKILNSAALIALVELELAPAWMVAAIIAREFAVSALRSVAASDNLVLGAIPSAKIKTITQMVAIALLIIYERLGSFERLAPVSLWIAMLVSLYSGFEYFFRYGPRLFGSGRSRAESPSADTGT
ncbi:MAG: CDP-diacylglycerol--glycerol-3-phosphate 3-phosphatidyltransferase [Thermoanaerobaculia bacterium]